MAGRRLHRWVFSWLCRWFPGRVRGCRRPIFRDVHPHLEILETRWSPVSINVTPPFEAAAAPLSRTNSDRAGAVAETRKSLDRSEAIPSDNLALLVTPRQADDSSVLVRTPQMQEPSSVSSQPDTTALDALFSRLSSRPFSPLSTAPSALPTPANSGGGGGSAIGGRSTPNAGLGGGGPTGGGTGPGIVNANNFIGVNFGQGGNAPATNATPAPAFSFQQAFFAPASSEPAGSSAATPPAPVNAPSATPTLPAPAAQPKPLTANTPVGHDPLYVIDLNTGETIPSGATLNSFAGWSENLLAQVSGATVSNYTWNLSQATDFTALSGSTLTNNLLGTWTNFSSGTKTDTISVTETAGSSHLTLSFSFQLTGTSSPAYSTRPTSTPSTGTYTVTPDTMQVQQVTAPGGPYANLGLADGSVQTAFTMPSYNPNVDPLQLDYASTAANDNPIFLVHYQLPSTLPSLVTAQLSLSTNVFATVSYNPSNLNPGDWMQIGLQANAQGVLNVGRYAYSISVYNGTSTTPYSGNMDYDPLGSNRIGAGWWIDGLEQVYGVSGGIELLESGGNTLFFANNGSGGYITPAGDFSLLTKSGSTWQRTMPDGTEINFNSTGLETSAVDRDSNTTTYSYDSTNQLTAITDMNGQTTALAYNGTSSSAKLTLITDPANRMATLAYNASGDLTSITDPASEVWKYGYNSSGNLTALTDPRSNTSTFSYDFAGRVTSVTQPGTTTMTLAPEQVNGLAATGSSNVTATLLAVDDQAQYTDANSNVWTTELDWFGFGQSIQDSDPLSDTSFTYRDVNGLPWLSSDPLARRTREFFNSQGNATMVVAPDDTTQQYAYNNFSEVTLYTNQLPSSNLTTYSYNSKGDLTQLTDPLSHVTTYLYNSAGLVTSMTDPNGNTTTSVYDLLNRLTNTTDALHHVTTLAYDSASDLTSMTNVNGYTTTYSYDPMGRKTSETVQIVGTLTYATTTFAYDPDGNLTSSTDPLNHTTTYGFDALNRRTAMTDPLGHQTTYGYDANGNETSVTDPLHRMTTYGYDIANRRTSSTDPAGDQTTTGYDAAGEVTSVTDPMGNTTTTTYTLTGLVSSVTDPIGNQTTYGYDAAGYKTSQTVTPYSGHTPASGVPEAQSWSNNANHQATFYTDAAGNQTTYGYDNDGNLTLVKDGLGHQTTYKYDAVNRLTTIEDALGDLTTYAYDAVGNRTLVEDPLTNLTTSSYDGANRLTKVTDPLTGVTTYAYDLAGNLTSLTDSKGYQTTYAYDAANRQTKMTDPLGHAQTYAYDAANELTSTTDRDGRTINYSYDQAGRMTNETWVSGSYTATWSYNKDSLVTLAQDTNSKYTYAYNADSQVTSVDNAGTPGGMPTVTLSYAYDGFQNVTSLTDTEGSTVGATVAYSYDPDNQLTNLGLTLGGTQDAQVAMNYDAANNLTGITQTGVTGSHTITSTLSYDSANRLTNLTDTDTTNSTTLANYTYGYNPGSQLTSYTDNSSTSLTYSYDKDGQLTSVTGTQNGSSYNATYSYDTNGNRTMTGYSTGTGNELKSDGTYSYTYDNDGNLTTQTTIATGSVTYYTWDYRNRLTEVEEKTSGGTVIYDEKFTYDINNNRIGVSLGGTQQLYTVYDGKNPYIDFNGSGTLTERYLVNRQTLSQFYGQVNASGTTQWFLTDNINSVRQVVSTGGTVLDKITYDPYGGLVSQTNSANAPRFLYTGGAYDSNTGNYQFDARYYRQADGRFVSEDPMGFKAGDADLYRYVFNAPTNNSDPSGLWKWPWEQNANYSLGYSLWAGALGAVFAMGTFVALATPPVGWVIIGAIGVAGAGGGALLGGCQDNITDATAGGIYVGTAVGAVGAGVWNNWPPGPTVTHTIKLPIGRQPPPGGSTIFE